MRLTPVALQHPGHRATTGTQAIAAPVGHATGRSATFATHATAAASHSATTAARPAASLSARPAGTSPAAALRQAKLATAIALVAALTMTACAQAPDGQAPGDKVPGSQAPDAPRPQGTNLIRDGYQGRFTVLATVLESPQHGPQLCIAVATSLPPQCGGPDIKGWKWDGLKAESAAGTTWGSYQITGTFDGKTFSLTEPAAAPGSGPVSDRPRPDFKPACDPKPAADPAKNSELALSAAIRLAQEHPDYGGLWLSNTPPADATSTPGYDPAKQVLNVSFTKDLAAREADLRRYWGGLLCVTQAKRAEAELRRIQSELSEGRQTNAYSFAVNEMSGVVEVEVFAAYEAEQRQLDAKYGTGTVILYGALKPID